MSDILLLLAGALLCNAIPHVTSGLMGSPFPTPFAKPRGIGPSSPLVNFLWGGLNLMLGLAILAGHPVAIGFNEGFLALVAGALALGALMSRHFGKVKSGELTR
ncbi:hypothetical protein ACMDCR_20540 [Labrys okinawensis]|uniref:hypothetical protein n=1 Tax=Labrys okinawensis TaxID=346911 RepID=UPI0039BCDCE2